jgi:hypothetical protein
MSSAPGGGSGANATDGATWPASAPTAPLRPAVEPLSVEAPAPTGRPGPLSRLAAWARSAVRPRGGAAFTRLDGDGEAASGGRPGGGRTPSTSTSPEDAASLPARLLFTFVDGLVRTGLAKPLETDDLWPVSRRDAAGPVSARFEAALAATADAASPDGSTTPSLAAAAWAVHGRLFTAVGVLKLVHDLLLFAGPYILERLLHHLSSGGKDGGKPATSTGLALAAALAAVSFFFSSICLVWVCCAGGRTGPCFHPPVRCAGESGMSLFSSRQHQNNNPHKTNRRPPWRPCPSTLTSTPSSASAPT